MQNSTYGKKIDDFGPAGSGEPELACDDQGVSFIVSLRSPLSPVFGPTCPAHKARLASLFCLWLYHVQDGSRKQAKRADLSQMLTSVLQ